MTKLNPCPRCGSEPDIFERNSRDISFQAGCGECGDETFIASNSANGAINAWNAATSEQPVKTLRDEFAAIALPLAWHTSSDNTPLDDIAARAYNMADSMLKERRK